MTKEELVKLSHPLEMGPESSTSSRRLREAGDLSTVPLFHPSKVLRRTAGGAPFPRTSLADRWLAPRISTGLNRSRLYRRSLTRILGAFEIHP